MTDDNERRRELGLEMGSFLSELDAASFPMEKSTVIETYGDHLIGFPNDESATVESILEPAGVERFESRESLQQTVYHMVGGDAVGERGQTGRGTSTRTPPAAQRPPGKPDAEEDSDTSF